MMVNIAGKQKITLNKPKLILDLSATSLIYPTIGFDTPSPIFGQQLWDKYLDGSGNMWEILRPRCCLHPQNRREAKMLIRSTSHAPQDSLSSPGWWTSCRSHLAFPCVKAHVYKPQQWKELKRSMKKMNKTYPCIPFCETKNPKKNKSKNKSKMFFVSRWLQQSSRIHGSSPDLDALEAKHCASPGTEGGAAARRGAWPSSAARA